MLERRAVRLENQIVEQGFPAAPLRGRKTFNRQQAVQQRVRRRVEVLRDVAPPIIDEYIEILERLDIVPPQRGDVDRIAGAELGDFGDLRRLGIAGKTREVRIADVNQSDGLTRRGQVERTHVQISYLVR